MCSEIRWSRFNVHVPISAFFVGPGTNQFQFWCCPVWVTIGGRLMVEAWAMIREFSQKLFIILHFACQLFCIFIVVCKRLTIISFSRFHNFKSFCKLWNWFPCCFGKIRMPAGYSPFNGFATQWILTELINLWLCLFVKYLFLIIGVSAVDTLLINCRSRLAWVNKTPGWPRRVNGETVIDCQTRGEAWANSEYSLE